MSEITNYNYLQTTNFKFSTSKIPGVEYFCTDVQWPAISVGSIQQNTPRGAFYEPGVGVTHTELTLDFLVDEDMVNWFSVYDWMRESAVPPKNPTPYPSGSFFPFADVNVAVLDNNSNVLYIVTFVNAFPTTMSGLTFDSDVDQPVPLRCSVTFAFDHIERGGASIYD